MMQGVEIDNMHTAPLQNQYPDILCHSQITLTHLLQVLARRNGFTQFPSRVTSQLAGSQ